MNTLSSLLSPLPNISPPKFSLLLLLPTSHTQTLGFRFPRPYPTQKLHRFRAAYKFPNSIFPTESQLSESDDDDDDDEEAAEEYYEVSDEGEAHEDEIDEQEEDDVVLETSKTGFEEFKWQRVERVCNDVKLYGEDYITADELASVYDFRIDKFQVDSLLNSVSWLFHLPFWS